MKKFTPVSDDQIYKNPLLILRLVPYQVGTRQPVNRYPQGLGHKQPPRVGGAKHV